MALKLEQFSKQKTAKENSTVELIHNRVLASKAHVKHGHAKNFFSASIKLHFILNINM